MESFRRLFQHNSGGGAANAGASSSSDSAVSRGADDQDVIPQSTQDEPMQLDSHVHAQANTDDGDDMPALVDPSDSSDDDEAEDNDSMEASSGSSSTTDLPASASVAHPQINPVDRVPDRRPRVDDIDDDDDERARRTPTVPPGSPTPLSSAGQSRAGSQSRPIRPLPRAFSSGRGPIPLAGTYVMQGLSFAFPGRGSNLRHQHQQPIPSQAQAQAQAGLVEPLAATPASATPVPVGAQHPNANPAPPSGTANAADGNQHDNPPAWLTGMLASIMNSLAHGYARPPDAQTDAADGMQGASMNMFFPDVGVAASATARQAPRAQAPPASTPGAAQAQNNPGPVPGPMPTPTVHNAEAAFAEFHRMHAEAMRALHQRTQQLRQGAAPQQQQGAAPAPSPHAVPVPVPVPIPLPLPFAFGTPISDEPVEDPAQARRLIEGLEEVPAGLVKRYMHVEQTADDGTGACAICWEPLDAGLEATDDAESQHQSDDSAEPTVSDSASTAASASVSASEDTPAQPSEAPLRPRIVVLPCRHPFHSICLEPWFSQRTTCPNCRYNVDPDGLTSSAYITGRRRVPGAFGPFQFGPPPGFVADLMAQLTGQGQSAGNQEPQPGATPNAGPPPPPHPARFTVNISPLGPFPIVPPQAAQPQEAPVNPPVDNPQFPFNFWPAGQHAPQQAEQPAPAAPLVNGPRVHHHHHVQVVDGVPAAMDTFEIELDIGVTVPIGAQPGQRPLGLGVGGMPDMFFHIVTPLGDQQQPPQQQQQPPQQQQAPQQLPPAAAAPPRQAHPPGHPLHGVNLPPLRDIFGDMRSHAHAAPAPPQPRRKWARPESQGRTLRQHVELRERELGLRCDFTSCDLAPTDEDPAPHSATAARTIHLHTTGEKQCSHTFHPQCIVTAARVAAAGVGDEPSPSAVSCPLCRVEGTVDPEDWTEGERALQAELEA